MILRSLVRSVRGYVRAIATNRPVALRACDRAGPNVKLHGRPSVTNAGFIAIGRDAVIWSRPARTQLATGRDGALHIGPDVSVGQGSSITAEALVMIGEGARVGPFCTIFDTEDDALSGWGRSSRPVVIGAGARIGSKVTILPGTSIGDRAEIGPGSVVSGVIPPEAKASGVPARVVTGPSMPASTDVAEHVRQLVARVFDRPAPPVPSLELERLSGWGGEGALRLLVAIEDEFNLQLPPDEWLNIRTVADIVALVERCRVGAAKPGGATRPPPSPVGGGGVVVIPRNLRVVQLGLRVADLVALSVAFPIAYLVRDGMVTQTFPGLNPFTSYWPVLVLTLLLWIGVSWSTRVYDVYRRRPVMTEVFRVVRAVVIVAWAMLALGFLTRQHGVSRLFVGLYFTFALALLILDRIVIRKAARSIGRHAFDRPRFAIVGSSEFGRDVLRSIERSMRASYDFAGFVVEGTAPIALASHKVLGSLEDLPRLLKTQVLDEVIFALPRDRLDDVEAGIQLCEQQGLGVRVCVDALIRGAGVVTLDDALDMPMLSFTTAPSDTVSLTVKRAFDVLVSAVLLVAIAPLLVIIAIAVWIQSPGPIFAKSRRVGINGREFWLYVFRSERTGRAGLTTIGALLRRTGLDELPQFWNVLRGQMSLVGPRAPSPEEVLRYERWQRRCLSMKPGITCPGQGRGADPTEGSLERDLRYIETWSLWRDFQILARSIPAIFTGRGAR